MRNHSHNQRRNGNKADIFRQIYIFGVSNICLNLIFSYNGCIWLPRQSFNEIETPRIVPSLCGFWELIANLNNFLSNTFKRRNVLMSVKAFLRTIFNLYSGRKRSTLFELNHISAKHLFQSMGGICNALTPGSFHEHT